MPFGGLCFLGRHCQWVDKGHWMYPSDHTQDAGHGVSDIVMRSSQA